MDLSNKQLRILAFPDSAYDALICDGSIRAGKTSVMSVAFMLWAMRDFNRCNFAICSKTVQTAQKNVIKPLLGMSYIKSRFTVKVRKNGSELIVGDGRNANTFYIYGGKDEASYQLIQGITLAGVFLDEVALMPRSFVEQALARCSVTGSKFWFNCNPESSQHWFYQEWIKKAEEHNALHLHFTLEDNPGLDEAVRRRYETMYSGVFYQRYILGEWVAAEGLVYDMWDLERHVVPDAPEVEPPYFVSCDFGIQNATVFLLWARKKGADQWVCLREWYYSGRDEKRQKTCAELVRGLQDMLAGVLPQQVIVDPSAAALIAELRKSGYRVLPAVNDVLPGISDVSTMLQAGRLLISRACTNTVREFGSYSWDQKAAERGEDKPIKEDDHCMDAVRYMVRTKRLAKVVEAYHSPFGN